MNNDELPNNQGALQASEITEAEVEDWFDSEEAPPDLAREQVDIVQRYSDAQLRIVRSTLDLSLHNLRQSLRDSSYINMSPSYQRRHRWDTKKRSQLIESLLLNIPIPPLFLFENDYNQYEIMDGRQRLDAIKEFLENMYPLRGLEYWPELDGSQFGDLPPTIQRGLLRRTVSAIVLLAETSRPDDSEIDVRMALFKRLNTGGVKLNPQELRNALYPSKFNEMLINIAQWDLFRDTWRIPRYSDEEAETVPKRVQNNALYKTMADCELVLRFFAIRETVVDNRRGSLRRLMDKSMQKHANDNDSTVAALDAEYRSTLQHLFYTFEGSPFVLPETTRPSRPAYDALMVACSIIGINNLTGRDEEIRRNFLQVANVPTSYEVLIGRGNTVESIKERVALATKILTN
ncbi:MAG: DUF262 domain-containing protein [Desulfobulbus sp.]|nr:DUF262 domain-containing protein [Desulfobulbus sp.]